MSFIAVKEDEGVADKGVIPLRLACLRFRDKLVTFIFDHAPIFFPGTVSRYRPVRLIQDNRDFFTDKTAPDAIIRSTGIGATIVATGKNRHRARDDDSTNQA